MERRILLFLLISFAIIFGFDFVLKELGLVPEPPPVEEGQEATPQGEAPLTSTEGIQDASSEVRGPGDESAHPHPSSLPSRERELVEEVETPLYRVAFTNRGAQIQSWKLNQYLTQDEDDPQPIEFVYPEGHFAGPLSLEVADPAVNAMLREGLFEVSRDFETLDDVHPTGHMTFSYRNDENDLLVEKEFTFTHDSYLVDVAIRVAGLEDAVGVLLGTNFGVVEWGQGFIGALGPAWMIDGTLEKESPDPEIRRSGDVRWAALQDKYFISVMIPQGAQGVFAKTETEHVVTSGVEFPVDAEGSRIAFQLYAGPKQFDLMRSLGHDLEDTIDFGWFIYGSWSIVKAVAKPLFYVLRFVHDYTQNYGVAIILLTCGIKLLFVPLQYKSYKSMQGMQKIQPKIQAVQAKFKDDRERLNRELMKLYKEHKVNPVGGCLPMLLQMPVFISLFNILYMTVDLRRAPFALWITDLSIPDPYYVFPILMGASMVLQQKIMPTTMDPTQAKMMLLLPVFLTFLFLNFPAGLVIYWLTNNVLTILQQVVTDRFFLKPATAGGPAPAGDDPSTKPENGEPSKKKKGKPSP
ncbi:MAG: membrane protein insertase YidC [Nitrospira sp.]|nr:membrane protein insertase YidC [Nitrospira sp.]